MAPSLSVIIPSFNRRDSLVRLLESVASQDLAPDEYEVIVVLDGCTDDSSDELGERSWPFPLQVLAQPNRGPGAARNAGIAGTTGRICLFLDDDVSLVPGALRAHLAVHQPASPRAVLGKLEVAQQLRGYLEFTSRWIGKVDRVAKDNGGVLPATALYSGNLSIPRASLPEGGFREDMRRFEDTELGYRLGSMGLPLGYNADARALLHSEKTVTGELADATREGEMMSALWKVDPGLTSRLSQFNRRKQSAIGVRAVIAFGAVPLPGALVTLLARLPLGIPGASWFFHYLRLHAYLRGVSMGLDGVEEWRDYLNRPGELGK